MADNIIAKANIGTGTEVFATDDIGGVHYPKTKIAFGPNDTATDVSAANPLPVTANSGTNLNTSALALETGGNLAGIYATLGNGAGPAANTVNARLAAITTALGSPFQAGGAISNSAFGISGTLPAFAATPTFNIGTAPTITVTGALTDTQLRASAVPVSLASTTITGSVAVTGPLTDTQLRASAVPISAAALPLPTGAATETTLAAISTKTPALGVAAPSASSPVTLPNAVTVTGVAGLSALNQDLLTNVANGWFDAVNYHSATVQIIGSAGISAGAVTFEWTNDTAAAAAGSIMPTNEPAATGNTNVITAYTIAASTTRMMVFPILARYVRVRISTAFVGGTVQAIGVFSQQPFATPSSSVNVLSGSLTAVTSITNGVALAPAAASGSFTTISTLIAAATTNATLVKASAGTIGGIIAHNNTAAVKYVKIFNKATAPVPGTDTPVLNIPLPANSMTIIQNAAGVVRLATGIGFAITGGQALLDATAVVAGDVVLNMTYI